MPAKITTRHPVSRFFAQNRQSKAALDFLFTESPVSLFERSAKPLIKRKIYPNYSDRITMTLTLKNIAAYVGYFLASVLMMHGEEGAAGYFCGETTNVVEIEITDANDKTPVPNARIAFFDEIELRVMREIELRKSAGLANSLEQPTGVTAATGRDGKASLRCKVNYYKVLLNSGSETESISPRGQLRVECAGYRTAIMEMDSLFAKTSLENRIMLPPLKLFLRKGINRPPIPENVTVAKIDFAISDAESAAEDALSSKFFNQPEEYIFDELTSADWRKNWQIFSDSLTSKAQKIGLDNKSLERCLKALNQGRNLQTASVPFTPISFMDVPGSKEDPEVVAKREKEQKEAHELAMKEREQNPEKYYNDNLAIVPVGAYLARHSKGECWIIVCKWEYASENTVAAEPQHLGHIMVWAMDTKTAAVVAYVSCD